MSWDEFSKILRERQARAIEELPWQKVTDDHPLKVGSSGLWRNHGGVDPYEGQGLDWSHASPKKPMLHVESKSGMGYEAVAPGVAFITEFSSRLGDSHPCAGDFGLESVLSAQRSWDFSFGRLKDADTVPYEVPVAPTVCEIVSRHAIRHGENGSVMSCSLSGSQGQEFLMACEALNSAAGAWCEKTGVHPLKGKAVYAAMASAAAQQGEKSGEFKKLAALVAVMTGDEKCEVLVGKESVDQARGDLAIKMGRALASVPSDIAFGGDVSRHAEQSLPKLASLIEKASLAKEIKLDLSPQKIEALACAILGQDGAVKESLGKVPGLGHEIEKAKVARELLIKDDVVSDLGKLGGVGHFFVHSNGASSEYDVNQIALLIVDEKLSKDDLIWRQGMADTWLKAGECPVAKIARDFWQKPPVLLPPNLEDRGGVWIADKLIEARAAKVADSVAVDVSTVSKAASRI